MLAKKKYVNIRLIGTVYMISLVVLNSECTHLYINDPVVIENKELNITCSSAELSTFSAWTRVDATFYVGNKASEDCVIQGNDEFIIRCYHDDSYTYIVTILPHSDQHGEQWSCRINTSSDTVILNVSVPVKKVTLSVAGQSTLSLNENINTDISCVSSYGRPRANITWYIKPSYLSTTPTYVSGSEVCNTLKKHQDLVSVNCTKTVSFNRTYNDWYLECTAENINKYTPAASGSLKLNVTYTTNTPVIKSCTNNGVYKVIKNHIGNLTCSVDGGNPAGTLHWNCTGDITEQRGPNNNVSQTIVWTATQAQYCTCNSTNIAGTTSTSVYIDVLYPPVLSDFQNQSVFEADSVILQCDVIQANPPVYMTRWTSNKHNVSGTTLLLPNVTRHDDMIYTCTVYNTMDPSCHHVVQSKTSKSAHIEVLYPPLVNITPGKRFTVKEGDSFNYTCPVVPGNPTIINVTWKKTSTDTKVWTSSELLIHNISRYDDSVYTCYVTNMMVHSNGTTKLGRASAEIRLIVQYRAIVTYFHVQNYQDNTSIVVMEHTLLMLECRVQGNPTADVKIYNFDNEVKRSNTDILLYNTTAACSGKHVLYSCHGYNTLYNEQSTREVQLLVKCKPRHDPHANIQYNETGSINDTMTFSYTALAYPHPVFTWYRDGSSIDINDPRTSTSSSNLQTNLTIYHVEENDFGPYILYGANEFGSTTALFYLKSKEKAQRQHTIACTSQNVTGIVVGTISGVVILCGILLSMFLYRRRSVNTRRSAASEQTPSTLPVSYENLKIEPIPNVSPENKNKTASNQSSETNVDHTYEGLSPNGNDFKDTYDELKL